MVQRKDESILVDLYNIEDFNNKADIRDFLLKQWALELPNTKYRYFVEKLPNNSCIYLERPGRLNKGCDFVIYLENHPEFLYKNGNDKPPKHDFILNDIKLKKQLLNKQEYSEFVLSINKVYGCKTTSAALKRINNVKTIGEEYELILKLLRWFFIEQDITYWSGSGRQMLLDAINGL